jgi:NAD(P)-dependent dehydrogenase (short-subunit alcohol dehydrogenase family)
LTLEGKRAIVTGASHGLGRVISEALLREGASILVCARGAEDLERTFKKLEQATPGRVHAKVCNVANESEVDALVRHAESILGGVDILVANAGVYGPKGCIEDVDWADWVQAIQINLIGTVYCCRAFLPLLKKASLGKTSHSKVLILSGGGATKPLPFLSAYAASKAGIVRFGETLAEEVKPYQVDVNMVAPGALNTRLLNEVLDAGPDKVGETFYQAALRQQESGGTPLELGADLCVFLASAAADGVTGRLFSAQWDPWRRLGDFSDELNGSDIYTLRRIVPEDRGKNWDCQ